MKIYLVIILIILSSLAMAQQPIGPEKPQAYLGVFVDSEEISPLLAKHLQLKDNQGLVIINIMKDSPADKAGLEKDDIILSFQGELLYSHQQFYRAIRNQEPETVVALGVIHNGQRKRIDARLSTRPAHDKLNPSAWKYPFKPRRVETWEPGIVYSINPRTGALTLEPTDKHQIPLELLEQVKRKSRYTWLQDNQQITMEITGDIRNPDAIINVKIGQENYTGKSENIIEMVPSQFQTTIKECLETEHKRVKEQVYNKTVSPTLVAIEVDGDLNREELIKRQIEFSRQQLSQMQQAEKTYKNEDNILKNSISQWQKKLEELEKNLKEIQQQKPTP